MGLAADRFYLFLVLAESFSDQLLHHVEHERDAANKAAAEHDHAKAEDQQNRQYFHVSTSKYNRFLVFAIIMDVKSAKNIRSVRFSPIE